MKNTQIIKRLLTFVGSSRLLLSISLLAAVLTVLCSLTAPIIIGKTIDKIHMDTDIYTFLPALLLLTVIYLGYSLCSWCMMYTANKIAFKSSSTLRKQVFDKFEKLPISFYDTHARGDLISHFINDIDMISDGLLQGISTILSGLVTIIACISIMTYMNWQMSIVIILSAPFTYFVAKTITHRSQIYFQKQAAAVGQINGFSEEMLSQIKTVKAYHYEHSILQSYQDMNQNLYTYGIKSQFYGSLANPSTRFVTNIAYTLVGIAGAILALKGTISIGDISIFLIYSNLFSKPFNEITSVMTQLQSAVASARRIFTLLELPEETDDRLLYTLEHVKGEICFHDVSFAYTKHNPLMKNLSITIPAGSKVAIVGRTGAGKTTLVNLLMRFYDIQGGEIYIDRHNINEITRNSLRKNFGLVLQDTYLFEDSIAVNIAYGKKDATREEIISAAKKTGAHTYIKKLSNGYDTMLHANSTSLSQGQRQLLNITRVLLMDPSILILDEATSSIDTRSEVHVNQAMQLLMQNKTSFIIAHRLSTIIHADLILVMDHGDIVEQGTHEELLLKDGYYAQLFNSQYL